MQEKRTDYSKFGDKNPFGVPEGYFDALEDRVAGRIGMTGEKATSGLKFIRMVKPLLGLAASFALAFLLIYYPVSKILPWYANNQSGVGTEENNLQEEFLSDCSVLDDRSFFLALTTPEDTKKLESDEIISFLSDELDDYEVYSEIIN
ncbi:MAG: hypothetical protein AAGU19_16045 [Prolixibacteraceae bacterium]